MTQAEVKRGLTPFWDCHCHLSFLSDADAAKVIENRGENYHWVMGGYQPSEWEQQVYIKKKNPQKVSTCYGLHPWFVKSQEFDIDRDLEDLKIWVDQADFIGEVGLDFHGDDQNLNKELQINVFEQQLNLGLNKPYVFHIVQAHGQALSILKDYKVKGFIHSFSGSLEVAEQYIDFGLMLSFGSNVLNENYKKARQSLQEIPLESLLIESDCPSYPLDESDPIHTLDEVYKEVARLRQISVDELAAQVAENMEKIRS